eukprot:29945-Pelagococcus_subviridis.AAC.3
MKWTCTRHSVYIDEPYLSGTVAIRGTRLSRHQRSRPLDTSSLAQLENVLEQRRSRNPKTFDKVSCARLPATKPHSVARKRDVVGSKAHCTSSAVVLFVAVR